eukprot:c9437_g1_i1.p1 GENE.c9437_g1_i1~~c9437_g1_i1.p1  ORF type:complete len:487 (-),score=93.81 c9437_g1_i1:86-1546(-)
MLRSPVVELLQIAIFVVVVVGHPSNQQINSYLFAAEALEEDDSPYPSTTAFPFPKNVQAPTIVQQQQLDVTRDHKSVSSTQSWMGDIGEMPWVKEPKVGVTVERSTGWADLFLNEIIIPGDHDAQSYPESYYYTKTGSTYSVGPTRTAVNPSYLEFKTDFKARGASSSPGMVYEYGVTQEGDVYQQLLHGARLFDFRVYTEPEWGTFATHHGFRNAPLEILLADVARFMDEDEKIRLTKKSRCGELVFVRLKYEGSVDGALNPADQIALKKAIQPIAPHVSLDDPLRTPVGDLCTTQTRVFIIKGGAHDTTRFIIPNDFEIVRDGGLLPITKAAFHPESTFRHGGAVEMCCKIKPVIEASTKKISTVTPANKGNRVTVYYLTITYGITGITSSKASLFSASMREVRKGLCYIFDNIPLVSRINVLMVDFINRLEATAHITNENLRRLQLFPEAVIKESLSETASSFCGLYRRYVTAKQSKKLSQKK